MIFLTKFSNESKCRVVMLLSRVFHAQVARIKLLVLNYYKHITAIRRNRIPLRIVFRLYRSIIPFKIHVIICTLYAAFSTTKQFPLQFAVQTEKKKARTSIGLLYFTQPPVSTVFYFLFSIFNIEK